MLIKILVFAVTTACALNGCSGEGYERTPLGDAIDKASMKLLNEAYQSASDKNVICSPLGVMALLSLFAEAAGPQSKEQIEQFLGGGDSQEISGWYSELSKSLADEDPDHMTFANKIYVSNKYTLADPFENVASTYGSEVETLNFEDALAAAATINSWADEKTQGNIKEPIQADSLDSATAAALFNVIFFQGHWEIPFNKSRTSDRDFHIDDTTTVKIPTMRLVKRLSYTENKELGARMLELPYEESGFRMVIVLPDEINGLPDVLSKAEETGLLTDVFKLAQNNSRVNLFLPKFEMRTELDLIDVLQKVGVTSMFEEPAPGIVKDNSVVVSKAFQAAFIEVDEEGTTAGAVTDLGIMPVSYVPVIKFYVNHPFLYLILHEDKILFAGTFTH